MDIQEAVDGVTRKLEALESANLEQVQAAAVFLAATYHDTGNALAQKHALNLTKFVLRLESAKCQ